jgi:hypothetical protein
MISPFLPGDPPGKKGETCKRQKRDAHAPGAGASNVTIYAPPTV